MAIVGNHEACHTCGYNFTDFQYRFHGLDAVSRGSASRSRLYYSYDVPHAHLVFLLTNSNLVNLVIYVFFIKHQHFVT